MASPFCRFICFCLDFLSFIRCAMRADFIDEDGYFLVTLFQINAKSKAKQSKRIKIDTHNAQ